MSFLDATQVSVEVRGHTCMGNTPGTYELIQDEFSSTADIAINIAHSTAQGGNLWDVKGEATTDVITGNYRVTDGNCAGDTGVIRMQLSGLIIPQEPEPEVVATQTLIVDGEVLYFLEVMSGVSQ
jgi:hypothetical protein